MVIVVIIVAVAGYYIISNSAQTGTAQCAYDSNIKTYINTDTNCVINFLCINGKQAFHDACGCGCEPVSQ